MTASRARLRVGQRSIGAPRTVRFRRTTKLTAIHGGIMDLMNSKYLKVVEATGLPLSLYVLVSFVNSRFIVDGASIALLVWACTH